MASVVYNKSKQRIGDGTFDLNTSDIRARMVMANTTCSSQNDGIATLADFTTIDPADSTGYADIDMAGLAVNLDDANDRAEFDATDLSFTGLGGDASRNYVGVLLYVYVDGTNANDLPLAYIEFTTPITSAATTVNVPWDAEGIIQIT